MPPWPSVVTGAFASRALADAGRVAEVTRSPDIIDDVLRDILGEDFALTLLGMEDNGRLLVPVPADLVLLESVSQDSATTEPPATVVGREVDAGTLRIERAVPQLLDDPRVGSSCPLSLHAIAPVERREKPSGKQWWIDAKALAAHLAGKRTPGADDFVPANRLWKTESRLGIAIDHRRRTVEEGALYTTEIVSFCPGVRLVAAFSGNNIPDSGLIRLGGDGHGARIAPAPPEVSKLAATLGRPQSGWRGFRMVLATPGLFPEGWLPPATDDRGVLRMNGLEATLMAACVPRPMPVSGWDLANHRPKPTQAAAPAGSCYWFRIEAGDSGMLDRLWQEGFWPATATGGVSDDNNLSSIRQREGWSRVWFGPWDPK
ncbi:MAG: hypothetical protein D6815_06290 [Candidatus Dadabacteria bacterium]|nr:MAG: hypothetical protein D6815_06290 [Candidatus Dadabacteria bacterium]